MLTLFSTPKSFQGPFKLVQENAIRSWARLEPRPEIILLGEDEGTAEMAAEIGAIHIPKLAQNSYGTPLVNSIFSTAEAATRNDLMCYINADIILMDDFMKTVESVRLMLPRENFLMVGRKIGSVEIREPLDFKNKDWESNLRKLAAATGRYSTSDSDYFLYRKGHWPEIPPFAIGRYYWSAWLVYDTRRRGLKVVDATDLITAIEPTHDYSHMRSAVGGKTATSPEVASNAKLFQGCKYWTTANSSHVLTASGLAPISLKRRLFSTFLRLDHQLGLSFHTKPSIYHRPLHAAYRTLKPLLLALRRHMLNGALGDKVGS